jgi:hypothetical protein
VLAEIRNRSSIASSDSGEQSAAQPKRSAMFAPLERLRTKAWTKPRIRQRPNSKTDVLKSSKRTARARLRLSSLRKAGRDSTPGLRVQRLADTVVEFQLDCKSIGTSRGCTAFTVARRISRYSPYPPNPLLWTWPGAHFRIGANGAIEVLRILPWPASGWDIGVGVFPRTITAQREGDFATCRGA